jgi:DNA-binding CsgD family transcriptional regulator
MDEAAFGNLVESIYDMALEPALWRGLLERLAQTFGANAIGFEQENMERGTGTALALGVDDTFLSSYFEYYSGRNILRRLENPREKMRNFVPTITVDEEQLPKPEFMRTEFYADFLRPARLHSLMTLGLWSRDVNFGGLTIFRPATRSGFERADITLGEALQPHLIRAFRLSEKLAESRMLNDGLSTALDRSPYGLLVLSADGRVRHANAAAQRMLAEPGGISVLGGKLVASDAADSQRLQAMVAAAGAAGRTGNATSIRRRGERSPLSVVAAPVAAERFSLFHAEPGVVVCVSDPDAASSVSESFLRDLFGLTGAQARVARALMEGQTLREAAETLGLSFNTVRVHLARIFEKTGANRQAELVGLITRAAGLQAAG